MREAWVVCSLILIKGPEQDKRDDEMDRSAFTTTAEAFDKHCTERKLTQKNNLYEQYKSKTKYNQLRVQGLLMTLFTTHERGYHLEIQEANGYFVVILSLQARGKTLAIIN